MSDLNKKRESYYRVTEVLCPFSGYTAPAASMKKYQDRGTWTHDACNQYVLQGAEWWMGSNYTQEQMDTIQPYLKSFSKWYQGFPLIAHNERLYDDSLELTGEFDNIFDINGKITLIDIKTSKTPNKTWPYQMSAYKKLINEKYKIESMVILQLSHLGDFPNLVECPDDFYTFKKALDLYKIFCPRKRIIYEESE